MRTACLNVERRLVGEFGAFLDEFETRFGLGAHQPLDGLFGVLAVVGDQRDPKQRALLRVHGGFLELRRHHLAEPLEAADLDLGVGVKFLLQDFVAVLVVAGIKNLAAVREPIERRHREIEMAVVDELRHLPVEEGDEQRRDMGAVDVGVGHDDDAAVAQILVAVMHAGAAAERLRQIGELLVLRQLVLAGRGHVEDLAAQRQDRLRGAIARLFGRAAGAVAFDDEQFRALGGAVGAIGELAREAQLLHRALAGDVFFLAAADALLGALDDEVEQLVGLQRIAGEPVVERVLDRLLDDLLRFGGGEAVLGLALEFRLADEHRQHGAGADHHIVGGDRGGALALADAFGVILQAARQRRAQAGFMGAAVRRRNGVAIGIEKAVGVGGPGHRPLRRAVRAGLLRGAGENLGMHQRRAGERLRQIVLEAVGEMERRFLRHVVDAVQQLLGAGPADFDAAEQIGLRARHLEHALGLEMRLGSENLGIGPEANLGAAAVGRLAGVLQFALRLAALEHHPIKLLAARDFDFEPFGQRIGDGDADAVQTARCFVDFGVEFAAGVQRAHDHFERGLFRKFRMRIDRNAAAIVGDGEEAVGFELDLDPIGMPGERLVHGIVDDFGEQVMQRLLVGAADIHAGAAAHRLEPFQHLDVTRGIALLGRGAARGGGAAPRAATPAFGEAREQVAGFGGRRLRRRLAAAFADFEGLDDFVVFPTACPECPILESHRYGVPFAAGNGCRIISGQDFQLCHRDGKSMSTDRSERRPIDGWNRQPYIRAHELAVYEHFASRRRRRRGAARLRARA